MRSKTLQQTRQGLPLNLACREITKKWLFSTRRSALAHLQRKTTIDGDGLPGDVRCACQVDRQLAHVLDGLRFTLGQ